MTEETPFEIIMNIIKHGLNGETPEVARCAESLAMRHEYYNLKDFAEEVRDEIARPRPMPAYKAGWWNSFSSFANELLAKDTSTEETCHDILRSAGITQKEAEEWLKTEEAQLRTKSRQALINYIDTSSEYFRLNSNNKRNNKTISQRKPKPRKIIQHSMSEIIKDIIRYGLDGNTPAISGHAEILAMKYESFNDKQTPEAIRDEIKKPRRISPYMKGWWDSFFSLAEELLAKNPSAEETCHDILRNTGITQKEAMKWLSPEETPLGTRTRQAVINYIDTL